MEGRRKIILEQRMEQSIHQSQVRQVIAWAMCQCMKNSIHYRYNAQAPINIGGDVCKN